MITSIIKCGMIHRACDYLSMLGLKSNLVNKMGHSEVIPKDSRYKLNRSVLTYNKTRQSVNRRHNSSEALYTYLVTVDLILHVLNSTWETQTCIYNRYLRQELNYTTYRQVCNIRRTLVGNKIVDHSDVVGASPVGAAPTTSSFST